MLLDSWHGAKKFFSSVKSPNWLTRETHLENLNFFLVYTLALKFWYKRIKRIYWNTLIFSGGGLLCLILPNTTREPLS